MLKNKQQRKASFITIFLVGALFLCSYYLGLPYQDPPKEYGLALNFDNFESEEISNNENKQENNNTETPPKEKPINENLIENKNSNATNISKQKPIKKEISKSTQSAVSNLLKNVKKENGNENKTKSKYYSSNHQKKNYNLAGRNVLKKPIFQPKCNEEGTVYVKIEVNQNGKVVKAIAGIKGSTNTNPCLLEPAQKAALQTRWNFDKNAPRKQIGIIIYRFRLSNK